MMLSKMKFFFDNFYYFRVIAKLFSMLLNCLKQPSSIQ